MAAPGVSVVINVHNGERHLREAVESVLGQTFPDLELVVVDDGSTDSTPSVLAECARQDARVVVHRQEHAGVAAALNRATAVAEAGLIAHLDADDTALPDRLERQLAFLEEHPDVALVGGAVRFVDEQGRPFADYRFPLRDEEIRDAFESFTPFSHSNVVVRRQALEAAGGYRPLFVLAQDADLWMRIALRHRAANLADVVGSIRVHSGHASERRLVEQTMCWLAARASWRAVRDGRRDPLAGIERIDAAALAALGVGDDELTDALVQAAAWRVKTLGRAGYWEPAAELWEIALRWARAPSGSPRLARQVHRLRAWKEREQGHALRARVAELRAVLAWAWAR